MTRSACDTAKPNPSLMICCDGLGMAFPRMYADSYQIGTIAIQTIR